MVAIGIGAIGVPTLVNSLQLIANATIHWGPSPSGLNPPVAIDLQLRYANGDPINASSFLPRYTSTGGPVFGFNNSEISLATGTQLFWGGRAHDARGTPTASVDLGLYYFIVKDGCDETEGRSCYTLPNLVAETETNSDGSFGFQGKLPSPGQDLPAWNLPPNSGKVIIVYADFLTPTTAEQQRVKTHYAVKLTEPPAISGIWIDNYRIVDLGRSIQYTSIVSGNVTFTFNAPLSAQQAYLAIGSCGSQACSETPPNDSIIIRAIPSRAPNSSLTVDLDPSYYVFYVLTRPIDPFKSIPSPRSVLAFGVFDTLHSPTSGEYQLLGLLPVTAGFVLLLSIPSEFAEKMSIIRRLRVKILTKVRNAPVKTIMAVAVISRGFVFATAIATASIFGERPGCPQCWNIEVPLINLFSRWDSAYYTAIALRGYSNLIVPRWEFFPGYPLTMGSLGRLLTIVMPIPLVDAVYLMGFMVSNAAFFGSVYYLYKLSVLVLRDVNLAFYSALCLAFYPAGVFLSATYSESLFLFLMLSSLYYWRMGKFRECALLGFFEALTRPVGILLVIPYLIELARDKTLRKSTSYLPILTVLLGFLSFFVFSQLMTGTPFAQFEAERLYWGVTPSLQRVVNASYDDILGNPIIVPYFAVAIVGMLSSILARKSKAESTIDAYALALLATYPYTGLIAIARYSITLIPVYWGYARWSQRAGSLIFGVFLVLLAIGVGLFVNWYRFY
jgi:hypothetical protein